MEDDWTSEQLDILEPWNFEFFNYFAKSMIKLAKFFISNATNR